MGLHNEILDFIMPWLRNPYVWAPVYGYILYFMWTRFRWKGIYWCLAFIITFGICDIVSASYLKPFFDRLRPCQDPLLHSFIRDLVACGSGRSFPSAHASNHFGLSFFILFTIGKKYRMAGWLALLWAFSVCFAQVYVGVHYPMDILGGAVLGFCVGWVVATIFNRNIQLFRR